MVVKGIKSFSDVITNSSSEVFVMEKSNAEYYDNLKDTGDCINIEEINWDWVHSERGSCSCLSARPRPSRPR